MGLARLLRGQEPATAVPTYRCLRTMNPLLHRLAPALALCLPLLTPAQPLRYTSAFADYKPYQDLEPGPWRALNDAVGAAALKPAGHASHGAAPPAAASAPRPAPAPQAQPQPHPHHRHHGGTK